VSIEIVRIHHAGVPVSDLDRSVAFFGDVFGLTPAFVAESGGPELSHAVGVAEAHSRMAFIPLPGGSAIELLQYVNPAGRPHDRANNDVGATHVCLEVKDIEGACRQMAEQGVEFFSRPSTASAGELAGWRFVYFKDPVDDITFELMQAPVSDPSAA
jgi:catechol 2,3-dioxygenase-like lactoylglutathione lyase family enzyme